MLTTRCVKVTQKRQYAPYFEPHSLSSGAEEMSPVDKEPLVTEVFSQWTSFLELIERVEPSGVA